MAYKVLRSVAARADLRTLFRHLIRSYADLGDDAETALARAAQRISKIEDGIDALGYTPHIGTLWPDLLPGVRWVTRDRAIFYFISDDARKEVRVLAVFFAGQNHKAHMRGRLGRNT